MTVIFIHQLRFSRLSILLTIIRIGTKEESRQLIAIAVVFLILLGLLIGQVFWVCESQEAQTNLSCIPTKQMAIFQLVCE